MSINEFDAFAIRNIATTAKNKTYQKTIDVLKSHIVSEIEKKALDGKFSYTIQPAVLKHILIGYFYMPDLLNVFEKNWHNILNYFENFLKNKGFQVEYKNIYNIVVSW